MSQGCTLWEEGGTAGSWLQGAGKSLAPAAAAAGPSGTALSDDTSTSGPQQQIPALNRLAATTQPYQPTPRFFFLPPVPLVQPPFFITPRLHALQVSVVSFKKGGLAVRCHTWDRNLGGRDIDELLFDHFCAEIKERFKLDIKSNAKASFKLRMQCQRLKKVCLCRAWFVGVAEGEGWTFWVCAAALKIAEHCWLVCVHLAPVFTASAHSQTLCYIVSLLSCCPLPRNNQVLSANSESPLNCECLMDDVDVHSQLNRCVYRSFVLEFHSTTSLCMCTVHLKLPPLHHIPPRTHL